MNAEKSSNTINWILFVVFTVIVVAMLFLTPQWFWLLLPFPLTFLVKALDVM
ncbi:MAG: hypothetical protein H6577_20790 [Lewinellaceae bacterium]|nr:hypothetical protein [Lewinellaceae bacterium]